MCVGQRLEKKHCKIKMKYVTVNEYNLDCPCAGCDKLSCDPMCRQKQWGKMPLARARMCAQCIKAK